jgi:hypothetical protein
VLGLQFVAGFATLGALRVQMPRSLSVPLALLVGMFTHTLMFFGFALANIPLSIESVLGSAAVAAAIPHIMWRDVSAFYGRLLARPTLTLTMYDVVTLGVVGYVTFIAFWAAWYWPVTPFDAMAGIDLVAKQAVAEGTLVNRVFSDPSLSGQLSNQPFYAPFAMLLQVIYRLVGFAYGQLWVPIAAFCLGWFTWALMRRTVHPFIADILLLLYVLTPEMLGYSYLVQTDHINAAYMAIAAMLMWYGTRDGQRALLWTSIVMFAAGCWARTETPLLVGIGALAALPFVARAFSWRTALVWLGVLGVTVLVVFALWHVLFFNAYLPVRPSTGDQLVGFAIDRFAAVVGSTVVNVIADTALWAGTFMLFAGVMLASIGMKRSFEPVVLLIWIVSILLGLWLVGTIFSAAIVEQTLRRGIFKIIPLMFVAMSATPLMQQLSDRLRTWEAGRAS